MSDKSIPAAEEYTTVDLLARDYPQLILAERDTPCLSLFQPTHRQYPESRQDPIRFGNLVKQLARSLRQKYPEREIEPLLAPLHTLAGDSRFWQRNLDGLAVLVSPGFRRVYRLQRPVVELAVVADSFHTKPLLRILQSADRYHVLGVNRHEVRLFEGNRHRLDEIELAPEVPRTLDAALDRDIERDRATRTYGSVKPGTMGRHGASDVKQDGIRTDTEQFFRAVDRSVFEHHSRPTGLPLLLAALPEHHHPFRAVSRNPNLLSAGIDVHPDDLTIDELCQRAWERVQPHYLTRLAAMVERFRVSQHSELATDDLVKSAKAAVAGRVQTLLLEADREIPGRMDAISGQVTLGKLDDPEFYDLLDDVGEQVLANGGEVIIVPAARMPTKTGLAAIYRY